MSPGKSWPSPRKRDFSVAGFVQWLPGVPKPWMVLALLPMFFGVSRTLDGKRKYGMKVIP